MCPVVSILSKSPMRRVHSVIVVLSIEVIPVEAFTRARTRSSTRKAEAINRIVLNPRVFFLEQELSYPPMLTNVLCADHEALP